MPRSTAHPLRPACRLAAALAVLLALLLPSFAGALDLGYRQWGLRAGAASDPDQGVAGFHLDLGTFTEAIRFQPSLELGFGDADSLQLVVPAHYSFDVGGDFTPYVGGGLVLAWIDYDDEELRGPFGTRRDEDDDFDIAPVAVGGVEWDLDRGSVFFLELQVGASDAFDAKALAGWTF